MTNRRHYIRDKRIPAIATRVRSETASLTSRRRYNTFIVMRGLRITRLIIVRLVIIGLCIALIVVRLLSPRLIILGLRASRLIILCLLIVLRLIVA